MSDEARARVQQSLRACKLALQARHYAEASVSAMQALRAATDIEELGARREACLAVGELASKVGFVDLLLGSFHELLRIDEARGHSQQLAAGLLEYSGIYLQLENFELSHHYNRRALELALAGGHMAEAASASTNLANTSMRRGDFAAAVPRLFQSLEYLEGRDDCRRTETITRAMLLQALDVLGEHPQLAVTEARPLWTRLRPMLSSEQYEQLRAVVERVAARHLKAHPELDAEVWRAEFMPEPEASS